MSFIFDALKKSEEERRRGAVPDLDTEHVLPPQQTSRRKPWTAILAAVLLLNAFLLMWWLRPWQPERKAAPAVAADQPVSNPVAPFSEVSPSAAPSAAPDAADPAAPMVPDATDLSLDTEVPGRNSVRPAPEPLGWSDLQAAKAPPAAAKQARIPASPSRATPVPKPAALPHLQDLPPAFRQNLPELDLSLHYYDAHPGARLVRLNGRVLREGGTVIEGLKIEEITPGGIILDWRGELFRVGDF